MARAACLNTPVTASEGPQFSFKERPLSKITHEDHAGCPYTQTLNFK